MENKYKSEIDRIIDRQKARLLSFIEPVNPPEIIKEAIRKYFDYAKEDIKNIEGSMVNGNTKQE